MTPEKLLATCTQSGVMLKWDGGKIKARGNEATVAQLLPMLKTHKAELHAYFTAEAEGYFEERAAIAEYAGGLSRADAEAQALAELNVWRNNCTHRARAREK